MIHLKRFSYTRMFRDKLDTLIDFPIEGLNLSEYCGGNPEMKDNIYDLYAVSNHFGGLGSGHYTAYAKNIIDSEWYNLDDSRVTKLSSPEDCKTKSAYVLFYKLRHAQGSARDREHSRSSMSRTDSRSSRAKEK